MVYLKDKLKKGRRVGKLVNSYVKVDVKLGFDRSLVVAVLQIASRLLNSLFLSAIYPDLGQFSILLSMF